MGVFNFYGQKIGVAIDIDESEEAVMQSIKGKLSSFRYKVSKKGFKVGSTEIIPLLIGTKIDLGPCVEWGLSVVSFYGGTWANVLPFKSTLTTDLGLISLNSPPGSLESKSLVSPPLRATPNPRTKTLNAPRNCLSALNSHSQTTNPLRDSNLLSHSGRWRKCKQD